MNVEEQMLTDLVKVALAGKHTQIEKIKTIDGLLAARTLKKANKKLSNAFSEEADKLFKEYIQSKRTSTGDFQKLIDFRVMKTCSKFYYEESVFAQLSISEYHNYMYKFHIIDTLLGKEREDERESNDTF